MPYLTLNSHLSREPKSMILCESVKQTSQIYDLVMVAYSVSTPLTLGRGVSYKVETYGKLVRFKELKYQFHVNIVYLFELIQMKKEE